MRQRDKERGKEREKESEITLIGIMFTHLSRFSFCIVTLIPFFTFSAFHALGYIRTNIIPNIFPRPTAAAASSGDALPAASWQAKTQQQIKSLTDKYYAAAMRFVAQSEVTVIAVRLFFGLFR